MLFSNNFGAHYKCLKSKFQVFEVESADIYSQYQVIWKHHFKMIVLVCNKEEKIQFIIIWLFKQKTHQKSI